jgi:hypothetical protein
MQYFLPQGYSFEAEANGHTFNVTVPMGGVEEGQRFSVPFTPGVNCGFAGVAIPRVSVPVGHWKVCYTIWILFSTNHGFPIAYISCC